MLTFIVAFALPPVLLLAWGCASVRRTEAAVRPEPTRAALAAAPDRGRYATPTVTLLAFGWLTGRGR